MQLQSGDLQIVHHIFEYCIRYAYIMEEALFIALMKTQSTNGRAAIAAALVAGEYNSGGADGAGFSAWWHAKLNRHGDARRAPVLSGSLPDGEYRIAKLYGAGSNYARQHGVLLSAKDFCRRKSTMNISALRAKIFLGPG